MKGVIEPGGGLRFAQEAGAALRAEAGVAQHFDGDGPVEQRVVGAIDHAHAAPAQLGVNAIAVVEGCANHVKAYPVVETPSVDYNSALANATNSSSVFAFKSSPERRRTETAPAA
jgi:hypothetical protein